MAIFLDIETVAIDQAADFVEPAHAPSNFRDPQKIADYIKEAEQAQIVKAALYPWTARPVAIGIDVGDGPSVTICRTEADEPAALEAVWKAARSPREDFLLPIVGFNHRAFDLPVLLARSLLLGVPAPTVNLDRYRTPHLDLLDRLTWFGAIPSRSLHWYAKRFGATITDDVTGADVAALVAAGKWEQVADHCASDLRLTRFLAERTGLVRGMKAVG